MHNLVRAVRLREVLDQVVRLRAEDRAVLRLRVRRGDLLPLRLVRGDLPRPRRRITTVITTWERLLP
ncbi:hypothetical protein FACS189419_02280 [Planctomycetales bacterium]|nr:hypothetical protein FACS189419_02280 [Planctomycetales bacterium]